MSETFYVTGGKGNARLISWSYEYTEEYKRQRLDNWAKQKANKQTNIEEIPLYIRPEINTAIRTIPITVKRLGRVIRREEESLLVKCKKEVVGNRGALIFELGKVYEATEMNGCLIVKDELKCLREVSRSKSGNWNESKVFKEYFETYEVS